jgi:hypothetical protein
MWIAFRIMSSSYLAHLVARRKFNSGPDPYLSIHPSIIPPHRACATSLFRYAVFSISTLI